MSYGNKVIYLRTNYFVYTDGGIKYNFLTSSSSSVYKTCLQQIGTLTIGETVTLTSPQNGKYLGGMIRIARLNALILFDFWNPSVTFIGADNASDYIAVEKSSNSMTITITNNWTGRVDYALYC